MGPLSLLTLCCIFMLAISAARGFKASRPVISRFTSLRASSFVMSTSSEKYVLVAVADGSEEIETVTIVDTLVRAGAKVVLASVGASVSVTCSRGVKLVADGLIKEYVSRDWDLICLPGGMPGAEHLRDSVELQQMLIKQNSQGKLISAICAAPAVALSPLGILNGKKATCYPAAKFRDLLQKEFTSSAAIVVDQNIITSQGPATSLIFSLTLVELLYGTALREKLLKEMCLDLVM